MERIFYFVLKTVFIYLSYATRVHVWYLKSVL